MLKLICIGFVLVASANAGTRSASITWGHAFEGQKFPAWTIQETKDKTEFTWNGNMNSMENALRGELDISFKKNKKSIHIDLKDLCEDQKKGSSERIAQKFFLKVIASQDKCPIKKGTKSTMSVPSSFSFSTEQKNCGPFRMDFKLFKKDDRNSINKVLSGAFKGNVTGC